MNLGVNAAKMQRKDGPTIPPIGMSRELLLLCCKRGDRKELERAGCEHGER